ncbi:helix-hairpin-helix domain-containing protein [Patescibacteria group bacterium]
MAFKKKKKGLSRGEFWQEYQWPLLVALIGFVMIGWGLWEFLFAQESVQVEIIPAEEVVTVWADIQGGVENPGVYQLPFGSRVKDLLIEAGGLSAEADREWLEKNINLAQSLTDGVKIYLPRQGETISGQVAGETSGKININTASLSQLDSLPGIGPKRSQDIIAGRPYGQINELQTVLPKSVFEKIKDQITVF